jgi:hypothetical protein
VFGVEITVCPHCGGQLRVIGGGRLRTPRTPTSSTGFSNTSGGKDYRGRLRCVAISPEAAAPLADPLIQWAGESRSAPGSALASAADRSVPVFRSCRRLGHDGVGRIRSAPWSNAMKRTSPRGCGRGFE